MRLRARWDWAASVGVPAHITIVFPFLPAAQLTPEVRRQPGRRSRPVSARSTSDSPGSGGSRRVVYLAPQPSAPFTRLTEAVVERFPGFPPYGGVFEEVIPHLTITESSDAPLR